MKKNMGSTDRVIRLVMAIVFAGLYFTGIITGTVGIVLIVLSCLFVLTGVVGFCPMYLPFAWSSVHKKMPSEN